MLCLLHFTPRSSTPRSSMATAMITTPTTTTSRCPFLWLMLTIFSLWTQFVHAWTGSRLGMSMPHRGGIARATTTTTTTSTSTTPSSLGRPPLHHHAHPFISASTAERVNSCNAVLAATRNAWLSMDLERPDPQIVVPWKKPPSISSSTSSSSSSSSSTAAAQSTTAVHPIRRGHKRSLPNPSNGSFRSPSSWRHTASEDPFLDNPRPFSSFTDAPAVYGQLWNFQWQLLEAQATAGQLTNLQRLPVISPATGQDLSFLIEQTKLSTRNNHINTNLSLPPTMPMAAAAAAPACMYTALWQCDQFRRIRMTYLDAGPRMQVFTTVWYPNTSLDDAPLLGMDWLRMGGSAVGSGGQQKLVTICDVMSMEHMSGMITADSKLEKSSSSSSQQSPRLQHASPSPFVSGYQSDLQQIRQQYPTLHEALTDRFYDPNSPFFSPNLLLGRFNDQSAQVVDSILQHTATPALQQYMQVYVNWITQQQKQQQQQRKERDCSASSVTATTTAAVQNKMKRKHTAYDTNGAQRDPAAAMLHHLFGKEQAEDYLYHIFFSHCDVNQVKNYHKTQKNQPRQQQ